MSFKLILLLVGSIFISMCGAVFSPPQINYFDINAQSKVFLEKTMSNQVMSSVFTPQQAVPTGQCRAFNAEASVCGTVIADGTSIFTQDDYGADFGDMPAEQAQEISVIAALAMLQMADPRTQCDIAIFTYFCNLIYAPCVEVPEVGAVPLIPCEHTYRDEVFPRHCPALNGIFQGLVFAPEGSCNAGLTQIPEPLPDNAPFFAPVTCNYPLVTVDPSSYPHSTIMGGPCTTPCPPFILSPSEYTTSEKFTHGWLHISQFVSIFLLASYLVIPKLRARRFILYFIIAIFVQTWMYYIPLIARLGQGLKIRDVTCSSPADEFHIDGWGGLCVLQGITLYLGMMSSLLFVAIQGLDLFLKVVLDIQIARGSEVNKKKNLIFTLVGWLLPLVGLICVLAYQQIDGNTLGTGYCSVTKSRDGNNDPDMGDFAMLLGAAIIVGFSYIFLISLVVKIGYYKLKTRNLQQNRRGLTSSQIRIIVLLFVMSVLYLGMFSYRLDIDNYTPKLGESVNEFIICLLTTPVPPGGGPTTCGHEGERQSYGFPMSWRLFSMFVQNTAGLTAFIVQGTSVDLYVGWITIIYNLTGWSVLLKWADEKALKQSSTNVPQHTTEVSHIDSSSTHSAIKSSGTRSNRFFPRTYTPRVNPTPSRNIPSTFDIELQSYGGETPPVRSIAGSIVNEELDHADEDAGGESSPDPTVGDAESVPAPIAVADSHHGDDNDDENAAAPAPSSNPTPRSGIFLNSPTSASHGEMSQPASPSNYTESVIIPLSDIEMDLEFSDPASPGHDIAGEARSLHPPGSPQAMAMPLVEDDDADRVTIHLPPADSPNAADGDNNDDE